MELTRSEEIRKNIEELKFKISEAAEKSGRKPDDIKLMAVSKTKPVEDIKAAYKAGHRLFGENRLQEAVQKFSGLPDDIELHMIGHLQRNKAKLAAENADCVQSIDRIETAVELDKRCVNCGRQLDFLVEINTSGEKSKSGYADIEDFFREIKQYMDLKNLRLRGLMTIAPFTEKNSEIRKSFQMCRKYFERLKLELPEMGIDTLSMGMSSDFVIAVEEGSTIVRVGTSIFGGRNY